MISEEHRQKVLGYYERAIAEGAIAVTGGGVPNVDAAAAGGFWVEPTIWTGLAHDSTVMREEIFGPCCGIIPFDTEDDAISWANDTDFGLCAERKIGVSGERGSVRVDLGGRRSIKKKKT